MITTVSVKNIHILEIVRKRLNLEVKMKSVSPGWGIQVSEARFVVIVFLVARSPLFQSFMHGTNSL